MTLLVRDEEDIVEQNICFHLNSGVDFVVAIDNGSIDKTPEILRKYKKKGLLDFEIVEEHTYEQSKWVSIMAKRAVSEHGATHLFHCDADEFWFPDDGDLKRILPRENEVFYISLINYLPPQDKEVGFSFKNFSYVVSFPLPYPEKKEDLDSSKLLLYKYPKKIMSSKEFTHIMMGNHGVVSPKKIKKTIIDSVKIHHFSIRSFRHFQQKVINGGLAYEKNPDQNPNIGWHWKRWYLLYKEGELEREYDKLSLKNNGRKMLKRGVIQKSRVPRRIRFAKLLYEFCKKS